MKTVDLIVNARWIIPIEPYQSVIEHGAIAVANGRIVAIDQASVIAQHFESDNTQHFTSHVLMPGLVNAHGHAAMTLLRGAAEDKPLDEWLNQCIWPLERALVNPEFVRDGMALAAAEMLRGGTTCFADHYFYPEHTVSVIDKIGLRAVLAVPIMSFAMPGVSGGSEAIEKTITLCDELRSRTRITAAFGPHAPYTVNDELLKRIAIVSAEIGVPVHMHIHESVHEIQQSVKEFGVRPLQRLHQLGLVTPQLMAVHATQLNDYDIAMLASNGVSVIHCPESNLKLANGFCPTQKLRDAGVNVALGTDGAASNNDLDMFGEMRTAALIAKAIAQCPTAARAYDMLTCATLNGAKAIGLESVCGSLVVGKAADFIAIDLSDLALQPIHDPVAHLVYNVSSHHVSDVWVDGIQLLKNRHYLTFDKDELFARSALWQTRVREVLQ